MRQNTHSGSLTGHPMRLPFPTYLQESAPPEPHSFTRSCNTFTVLPWPKRPSRLGNDAPTTALLLLLPPDRLPALTWT